MSLRSMTGCGRGEASARGISVAVELSSVNRKQLDVRVNLPRGYAALETRIHAAIHDEVARGRITGDVSLAQTTRKRSSGMTVDTELAGSYVKALRKTAKQLKLADDFGGSLLLSLPNVVRFEEATEDAEHLWPLAEQALKKALRQLLAMKKKEGTALQADLRNRVGTLQARLKKIRGRAPRVVPAYRKTLLKRIQDAGIDWASTDDRLLKEVALFADRSDIAEEITRLDSHLKQVNDMMRSRDPVGKSLDFLAQELFREINTIGSKANDTAIIKEVVEFKAELERFREQVQNIE